MVVMVDKQQGQAKTVAAVTQPKTFLLTLWIFGYYFILLFLQLSLTKPFYLPKSPTTLAS